MDINKVFGTGKLGEANLRKARAAYEKFITILGDASKCSFEEFMEDQEGTYGGIRYPFISHSSYMAYVYDRNRESRLDEVVSYENWKKIN
jgi:hypothetical protein